MAKNKEIIVCRCSDVTLEDIRELIRQGYTSVDEIKRISRAGMGPCQSKTCGQLIEREIARMTGMKLEELTPGTQRGPIKGIKMGAMAAEEEEKHEN